MEKPERICPILLLLFFTSFLPPTDGSPLEVLAAPNAIRAGMPENIFVEVQDFSLDTNIPVEIIVMNHPTKSKRLASTAVNLNRANSHQAFGEVLIPAEAFNNYDNSQHYVYLQAVFPERMLEKVVLVSFQTEYLFIQIDKNMYTPESRVLFRIFAMMPDFSYRANPNPLHIEIVNPEGHFPVNSIVLEPPGMYQGDIRIPENASPGLWKIKATYSNNPRLSCSAEFEVKEYVVPSLSVQLTPESMFFYEDEDKITVNINARYLFGEEVDGVAFVLFGIQHVGQKKPIPSSLQRVSIVRGKGAAVLQRRKITEAFGPLTGYSMYVKVTVLTESGGDMVVSEFNGIKIVKSPYTINLDKATKNFKPGIPYDLEFQVLNLDGTPAKLVDVSVEPGSMLVRTRDNGFAKLPINTEENAPKLTITIKTSHDALAPDKQATATFEVLPYSSPTKTYIHIVANTADLKLGDNLGVHCFLKRQEYAPAMITYLILSKGRLVKHSRWQLNDQMVISENILVTKEMMPSFTIIVYYHTSNNEVVSDSVSVDIKDTCIGSLQLEKLRVVPSHEPRKLLPVKITGSPGATVGLVAVHKDVYTDKWRLTQKKIWDEVKKKDRYCPLGGEYNSMRVFYEAGLLFESNIGSTPYRQDLRCPSYNRKKRSDDIGDNMNSYMDVEDIVSRSIFPKSWMWLSVVLPPCPGNDPYCKTTSKTMSYPLQDSITNWEITGISLSRTHGICVADPLEVIVRKDFFIDLKAPYSAIAGEQLEIKAVLHNYTPDHITVLVHLFEEENVCSAAYGRRTYRQEVIVGAMSSRSVSFALIFTKEGLSNIHVKAAIKDSFLNDGVMKRIYVVPWGELVKHTMMVTLDPARKGVDGRQTEVLQSQIPAHTMLPSTAASTVVYITGMASVQAENVHNLDVDILLPGRPTPDKFSFNRQNFHLTRSSKSNSINRPVRVTATGKGQGVLKMVSLYYTLPKQMERNCQKFNLSVQLIPQSVREDEKVYKLRIDVLYLSKDQDAIMSVLDIGLLTGFTVDTNDLDSLSRGRGRTISNYETGRVLSDRGSLIIYLDKVSHTQPVEISFRIREVLRLAVLQPAAVSVYEHKDQTSCVKFYHPARVAGQLMRLCTGNECKCAEEGCGILKRDANQDQRLERSCEVSRRARTDFVYKVRVDEISRDFSMDVYTMTILQVIREGSYDVNPSGKSRSFLNSAHCRDNLNLVTGKSYLIMGESKQIYRYDAQQSYQYVIGEQTWLEYWPTDAECQSDQHRPTCLGLDDLVSQQLLFGCVA